MQYFLCCFVSLDALFHFLDRTELDTNSLPKILLYSQNRLPSMSDTFFMAGIHTSQFKLLIETSVKYSVHTLLYVAAYDHAFPIFLS